MKTMEKMNMNNAVTRVDLFDARRELNDAMEAVGTILGIIERAMSLNDRDHGPGRAAAYAIVLKHEAARVTDKLTEIVNMCDELTEQEEGDE